MDKNAIDPALFEMATMLRLMTAPEEDQFIWMRGFLLGVQTALSVPEWTAAAMQQWNAHCGRSAEQAAPTREVMCMLAELSPVSADSSAPAPENVSRFAGRTL
jgi:hypothetical protein